MSRHSQGLWSVQSSNTPVLISHLYACFPSLDKTELNELTRSKLKGNTSLDAASEAKHPGVSVSSLPLWARAAVSGPVWSVLTILDTTQQGPWYGHQLGVKGERPRKVSDRQFSPDVMRHLLIPPQRIGCSCVSRTERRRVDGHLIQDKHLLQVWTAASSLWRAVVYSMFTLCSLCYPKNFRLQPIT